MNSALTQQLRQLRLPGMLDHWQAMQQRAEQNHWSHAQFLQALCELEVAGRQTRRHQRMVRESRLPLGKDLTRFEFSAEMAAYQATIEPLCSSTAWLKSATNVLLFGPSGVGKTHLAAAIGHAAIEQGKRVLYRHAAALVQDLQQAKNTLQLETTLCKLDAFDVIVIDEIGYVRKTADETHVLFELIAHRYESRSLIITSNQPFTGWNQIFDDNTMTVAAIDRLVHHAVILDIKAPSYRQRQAQARSTQPTQ